MLLPTPTGWTTLADLCAGDALLSPSGLPVTVATVSAPFDVDGFRVTLASGEHFDVAPGQRWQTQARSGRRGGRLTTGFLARRVTEGADERPIYCVPITEPLQLPDADLPIDPYVLGAWLGDGDTHDAGMTSGDHDRDFIRGQFHAAGFSTVMRKDPRGNRWSVYGLHQLLRENGLLGNKHVPAGYLRGSHRQRLALFQGLMDTDGTVNAEGQAEFTSTRQALADAALEVARTLGLKARMYASRAQLDGVDHGPCWKVSFWAPPQIPVFRLVRKHDRQRLHRSRRSRVEYIHRVEAIGPVTTREILLADADGHFLAGRGLVPLCDARSVSTPSPALVRAWARTRGIHVGVNGPVREEVVRAYRDAARATAASGDLPAPLDAPALTDNEPATPMTEDVPAMTSQHSPVRLEDNFVATVDTADPSVADRALLLW